MKKEATNNSPGLEMPARLVDLKGWTETRISELTSDIAGLCGRLTDEMIAEMRTKTPIEGAASALNDAASLRTALFSLLLKAVIMRIVEAIPIDTYRDDRTRSPETLP